MAIRKAIRFLLVVFAPSFGFSQSVLTGSPITGDIHPIKLGTGAAETNILFAKIAAGAAADDNNNNSVLHPIGGEQYFGSPSIAIQETRSHLAWDLSYHPTIRFYVPRSSHPDMLSQTFGGTLHYDVTKHLSIGLRQDYLRTSDPFDQFGDTPLQPGIGLINNPGLTFFGNFMRTELLSQAQVNYRLAKHTSVGVSGLFMQIQGHELGGRRTSLLQTNDTLGSAYLSHQFTARQAVGVQYQFLDIVFPGKDTRTSTHGVLLFDQIAFNPRLSLTVFAGPEYSNIHNQLLINILGVKVKVPVASTLWSEAAGATLDWRGDRLGLQASFVRRISDGGGLVGAVEMNDGFIRLNEKLARRWVANVDGELNRRTLLNAPQTGNLEALHVGAGMSHELARNLWVRARYQRIHNFGGSHSLLQFGNHNRVTVTIERDFTRPLGR